MQLHAASLTPRRRSIKAHENVKKSFSWTVSSSRTKQGLQLQIPVLNTAPPKTVAEPEKRIRDSTSCLPLSTRCPGHGQLFSYYWARVRLSYYQISSLTREDFILPVSILSHASDACLALVGQRLQLILLICCPRVDSACGHFAVSMAWLWPSRTYLHQCKNQIDSKFTALTGTKCFRISHLSFVRDCASKVTQEKEACKEGGILLCLDHVSLCARNTVP